MAKLKSFRRIITNDYPKENRDLVSQMGSTINDSITDILYALNGRLDIRSNIFSTYKELSVTVDSSGIPTNRTVFSLTNPGVPVLGISVISAVNQENTSVYPTGHPFISYSQIDSGILINHISGLQANSLYTIRLIAWN